MSWREVEMDAVRLLTSGLSLALPTGLAVAFDRLDLGMAAGLGAFLGSGSGHQGTAGQRVRDILSALVVGVCAITVGMVSTAHHLAPSLVTVGFAFVAALLGGIRASAAKTAIQAVVFMILGANLAAVPLSTAEKSAYFALGAAGAGAVTLAGYALYRRLAAGSDKAPRAAGPKAAAPQALGSDDPKPSLRADVGRWLTGLRHLTGWAYTLRLTACMAAAEIVAHLRPGPHSAWLALTVALVVQRDHGSALLRTCERGLGTALGVVLSMLLLGALPVWAAVACVAVIGATRPYLKLANYTAYAVIMTPLVVILTGLGTQPSPSLLRERFIDTLIACGISLVIGSAAGRLLDRT
ncbi:FUSC family protein [Streptomyces sp. NPDC050145]|uniref:FUSC family protein n=1 Tax=Streptomyces sp. NPDC050145 TaxID=3365602 RepID=UPI00378B597D